MMIIFWDKDDVLLTEYLPRGTTINGPYYTSIIERLRFLILRNGAAKANRRALLLHDNAPVHMCNIVQTAIREAGFIELNHPTYSPDIAPTDYHLFSNLKKFFRGNNFNSDDELITTVDDYLTDPNSEFVCKGIQSLHDR